MYSTTFLDQIRLESGNDPFSPKFNCDQLEGFVKTDKDRKLFSAIIWLNNNIFTPLFEEVNKVLKRNNFSYNELAKYTIAFTNQQIINSKNSLENARDINKEYNHVKEDDSFFENITDFVCFQLQLFSNSPLVNTSKNSNGDDKQNIDEIFYILELGNGCFEYKKHYENVVWSEGSIEVEPTLIKYYIGKYDFLKSQLLGTKSMQNYGYLKVFTGDRFFENKLFNSRRLTESPKIIDNVNFINGSLELRKRSHRDNIDYSNFKTFELYYFNLFKQKLPSLNNLTLLDCFEIFSEIQEVISKLDISSYSEKQLLNVSSIKSSVPLLIKLLNSLIK